MPLYEFKCNSCGERFEKLVRWSDAEQKPHCPFCGGEETHKLISTIASFGSGTSDSGGSCGSSGGFS